MRRLGEENLNVGPTPRTAPFAPAGVAIVFGVSGGIGNALATQLHAASGFATVLGYSRSSAVPLDLGAEASIETVAARRLLTVTDTLRPESSEEFIDHRGRSIQW